MSKKQSILNKVKTISHVGLKPYNVGKHNFENPIKGIEELAEKRTVDCMGCENYVDEPVDFLRVVDDNIPALSNKMCGSCGCTLAYKLRQSIEPCKLWRQEQNT